MLHAAVLEELEFSERVVRGGHEVVPRFRIIAPDGEHTVLLPLPDETAARVERFAMVRAFMIWKAASGFVKSTELIAPDAITTITVTRDEVRGALRRIIRSPIGFAEPEWFGRETVSDEILSLLPSRSLALSENDMRFIDQAFVLGAIPGIHWMRPGESV